MHVPLLEESLTFNKLRKLSKKDNPQLESVNMALLGDTSTQLMSIALKGYAQKTGFNADLFEGDYDQIDLIVSDPSSELYAKDFEFIIIYKSVEGLQKKFYNTPPQSKSSFSDHTVEYFRSLYDMISSRTKAKIIFFNFEETPDNVFYNYGNNISNSWVYQLRKINLGLMELVQSVNSCFIFDIQRLTGMYGRSNILDNKLYVLKSLVHNLDFLPLIAKALMDMINVHRGKFKKCLILDLDNTTWGGVIGDDGIDNINIGDLGVGKAFTTLQKWAKDLSLRGVILAICSKNTHEIAIEPFEKHPEMILRMDDISVFVANWESKADNIRYIQSILNIGFDSIVFLDDNPFERNLIRKELPEVTVPELPKDPVEYMPYLERLNLFETASYSGEDKNRTKRYQEESKRVEVKRSFESLDQYLSSLEMSAEIKPFDKFSLPRIVQLIQRSNQFNFRTIRYSEKEILDIMESATYETFYVKLKDKFGEYGIISLLIVEKLSDNEGFIDTWIMSCRVLKRGVEDLIMNQVVHHCKGIGIKTIKAERIPTRKNSLVKDVYSDLGYNQTEEDKFELSIASYNKRDNHIQLSE